jgi:hypothetical protein
LIAAPELDRHTPCRQMRRDVSSCVHNNSIDFKYCLNMHLEEAAPTPEVGGNVSFKSLQLSPQKKKKTRWLLLISLAVSRFAVDRFIVGN